MSIVEELEPVRLFYGSVAVFRSAGIELGHEYLDSHSFSSTHLELNPKSMVWGQVRPELLPIAILKKWYESAKNLATHST